jgi:hypothetical protein
MVRIFGFVFAVAVWLLLAWGAGSVADRRGRPFWLYFAATLVVGPLALLAALLLPRRRP